MKDSLKRLQKKIKYYTDEAKKQSASVSQTPLEVFGAVYTPEQKVSSVVPGHETLSHNVSVIRLDLTRIDSSIPEYNIVMNEFKALQNHMDLVKQKYQEKMREVEQTATNEVIHELLPALELLIQEIKLHKTNFSKEVHSLIADYKGNFQNIFDSGTQISLDLSHSLSSIKLKIERLKRLGADSTILANFRSKYDLAKKEIKKTKEIFSKRIDEITNILISSETKLVQPPPPVLTSTDIQKIEESIDTIEIKIEEAKSASKKNIDLNGEPYNLHLYKAIAGLELIAEALATAKQPHLAIQVDTLKKQYKKELHEFVTHSVEEQYKIQEQQSIEPSNSSSSSSYSFSYSSSDLKSSAESDYKPVESPHLRIYAIKSSVNENEAYFKKILESNPTSEQKRAATKQYKDILIHSYQELTRINKSFPPSSIEFTNLYPLIKEYLFKWSNRIKELSKQVEPGINSQRLSSSTLNIYNSSSSSSSSSSSASTLNFST